MPESALKHLNRILAVRLDNIGDVIMLGPALRALRDCFPAAKITLMTSPAGSQAAPLLPWIDEVLTWRASWQDIAENAPLDVQKEHTLVETLAQGQFDAAFIFTSFSQSPYPPAYACYLAGIPVRVGQSKEFGGAMLSHWVKPGPDSQYQVERNLHLLRSVGIPAGSARLSLRLPEADRQSAATLLHQAGILPGNAFVALAPGASAAARRYDQARLAAAVRQVAAESGLPLVLLGSPREHGRFPALETLADELPTVRSLIGKTSLAQLAAVIQQASLVIANNSGALHIAAAFQRPLLVLYSGTELFEQWLPPFGKVRVLQQPVGCSPCYRFQCPYQMECLDIPAQVVAESALSLLQVSGAWPRVQVTD